MYHTYVLVDSKKGVYYVGSGNEVRLKTTVSECKRRKYQMRLKCLICNFNNTTVHTVFSSTSKFETLLVEQALIDAYGDNLVNKCNVYQVVS